MLVIPDLQDTLQSISAWVAANREWLFSGVAIALIGWFGRLWNKKREHPEAQQIGGEGNILAGNIHSARDVIIVHNAPPKQGDKRTAGAPLEKADLAQRQPLKEAEAETMIVIFLLIDRQDTASVRFTERQLLDLAEGATSPLRLKNALNGLIEENHVSTFTTGYSRYYYLTDKGIAWLANREEGIRVVLKEASE